MGETSENQNPLVSQATSLLLQSFMQQPAMTGSSNQTVSSSPAEFQAGYLEKWKQQREDFDKIFSHRDVHDLLLHAFQCELLPCQDPDCLTVKQMYRDGIQRHGIQCSRGASGGCVLCTKMRYFLGIHARNCRKEFCYVPLCSYWKWSQVYSHPLQTFPRPQFSQPLQMFPRPQFSQPLQNFARSQPILPGQAVAMGIARQRAAEAGPGYPAVMAEQIRIANQQRPVLQSTTQSFQTPIDLKKQVEDFDKTFSEHRDVLDLMVHAFQCELPQCQDPDCVKMKGMYRDGMQSHGVYCNTRSLYGRCDLCTKMQYFLQLHAQNCKKEFCYVPHCSYHKVSTQMTEHKQNPQQAAPMEMTRKRAAEAASDTMDEHQLNRSDQNPLKSQKRVCKVNTSPPFTASLTKSTSLTETVNGSHQFKITGYSLLKGLGVGKYIASDTFSVGGYEWAIYFYPDGKFPEDNAAYVSCFIALVSEGTDVRALFELTLMDQSGKEMHKVHSHFGRIPENGPFTLKHRGCMWGYKRLFKRTTLEKSDYFKDDCLLFHCRVGVIKSQTEGPKICSISMENSTSEHSCQLCGAKELTSEPPSGHVSNVPKTRLQKKKNNEETDEWWIQCDKCEAWQHQICALYNGQKNEGKQQKYTCAKCYIGEVERGERTPSPQTLGAKDLPKTTLSDHIELWLFKRLRQEKEERARFHGKSVDQIQGAESLTVRVVSSIDKMLEVNPRFLEILEQENYPSELPYKSKVILLFQEIEGVEVCLFGLHVQEYGSECQNSNQRAMYLSYLDSVKYFKPEIRTVSGEVLRTFVYHEFLIGYLEYCKLRGFTSCYIWACPPLKDDEYIFYCHPEIQKTPESDKLREWLQAMLRKASKENIVTELTNLYDHFFISAGECKAKVTASRLPYFDGDFWPGAAGDIINQLQQTYVQTDLSANDSKDDVLMQRLGETIRPMKEDFIVVHLQHSCNHCRKLMVSGNRWVCNNCSNFQLCDRCYGVEQNLEDRDKHPINSKHKHIFHPVEVVVAQDTKDKDVILDCEYFDTRQSFVALCRGNQYQFDTLRRAKHSSMMVLYHIHNPTSIAFAATCNMCQQDTEAGDQIWWCNACPHYDVCNFCFQKDGGANHPHQLTIHTSTAQVRDIPDFLVHAFQCKLPQCQYRDCLKIKELFRHGTQCKIRVQGGCLQCKKMCHLFRLHARNCKTKPDCCVPHCRDIKNLLKSLQEQFDTRRRVAMMEMTRQQAEETVMDKMGHLSVADNAVDTVDEEDYGFAEVVVDKMGHLYIQEPVLDKIGEHQSVDDDEWICI